MTGDLQSKTSELERPREYRDIVRITSSWGVPVYHSGTLSSNQTNNPDIFRLPKKKWSLKEMIDFCTTKQPGHKKSQFIDAVKELYKDDDEVMEYLAKRIEKKSSKVNELTKERGYEEAYDIVHIVETAPHPDLVGKPVYTPRGLAQVARDNPRVFLSRDKKWSLEEMINYCTSSRESEKKEAFLRSVMEQFKDDYQVSWYIEQQQQQQRSSYGKELDRQKRDLHHGKYQRTEKFTGYLTALRQSGKTLKHVDLPSLGHDLEVSYNFIRDVTGLSDGILKMLIDKKIIVGEKNGNEEVLFNLKDAIPKLMKIIPQVPSLEPPTKKLIESYLTEFEPFYS